MRDELDGGKEMGGSLVVGFRGFFGERKWVLSFLIGLAADKRLLPLCPGCWKRVGLDSYLPLRPLIRQGMWLTSGAHGSLESHSPNHITSHGQP